MAALEQYYYSQFAPISVLGFIIPIVKPEANMLVVFSIMLEIFEMVLEILFNLSDVLFI